MEDKKRQAPQEIQINDTIAGADYSNFINVSHNKEEFHLIFGNVLPPSGKVVSKIITTPAHYRRMIEAMSDNLRKYEEKFGKVAEEEPGAIIFN